MIILDLAKRIAIAPLLFFFGFVWMGAVFEYPYLQWLPTAIHGIISAVCFVLFVLATARADYDQKKLRKSTRLIVSGLRTLSGFAIIAALIVAGVYQVRFILICCVVSGLALAALDFWIAQNVVRREFRNSHLPG